MALSKPTAATPGDNQSRASPAVCGALMVARDSHPYYVVSMDLNHAKEAIDIPENCSHCLALPKKFWRRRLNVATTQSSDLGQCNSDGEKGNAVVHTEASRDAASLRWTNQNDPALFVDVLSVKPPFMDEPPSSEDEGELGLLNCLEDEDAIPSSVTPQTDTPIALPQLVLFEACEQTATRLRIELPAHHSACDQEWDAYDGKLLGPPPCPRKHFFPVLPRCAKLIKH